MALFHLGQSGRWRGVGKNIWGLPRRLDTDGQELCDERFNRSFWPTCFERFEWNGRSGKKLPFCQLLTNFLIEPKFKQQWRMFLFTEMIFHTLPGIEMSPHDSLTEGVKKRFFLGQSPKRGGQGSASPWFCLKKSLFCALKTTYYPFSKTMN